MTYQDIITNARTCIGPYCKACPVCNGKACGAQMPGPGAKGVGDTAIRNYDAWKRIRINMDTISENVTPDTTLDFFGHTMKYPFFAGPVGAVKLHYGDSLDDVAYNDILVSACADAGIAAFTGDGTNPAQSERRLWNSYCQALGCQHAQGKIRSGEILGMLCSSHGY